MAKNTMDNSFAREVKSQQLRHFFNLLICNMDNIDLFYQYYYYKNVFMQQPADFLQHNLGVYAPELIKKSAIGSRNGPNLNIASLLNVSWLSWPRW
jgi:hypothetical protein